MHLVICPSLKYVGDATDTLCSVMECLGRLETVASRFKVSLTHWCEEDVLRYASVFLVA